jgi:hypothetical protein
MGDGMAVRSPILPILPPASLLALLLLGGCPSSQSTGGDAAAVDAVPGGDDPGPWRHTIVIDGNNDFAVEETFSTTTAGYAAYVTWDDRRLYVGYAGADIAVNAPDSETKWVMVYLDTDPGGSQGSGAGELYNTQQPGFPDGFLADHYYRWKSNDTFEGLRSWTGSGWTDTPVDTDALVTGEFMELSLSLSALGDPPVLRLVTFMLNEKDQFEWSYAGLYRGSFTDGYFDAGTEPIPITSVLTIDRQTAPSPTDGSRGP